MDREICQEQTTSAPHKGPLGIETPEEDHREETNLEGTHPGEDHREEIHQEEAHWLEETQTTMSSREIESILERSAATSMFSMGTEQKPRNSRWNLA